MKMDVYERDDVGNRLYVTELEMRGIFGANGYRYSNVYHRKEEDRSPFLVFGRLLWHKSDVVDIMPACFEYMTTKQAANALNISIHGLYQGKSLAGRYKTLKPKKDTNNGVLLWKRDDVEALLAKEVGHITIKEYVETYTPYSKYSLMLDCMLDGFMHGYEWGEFVYTFEA